MKELTYFYLKYCPYCLKAEKLMEEVIKDNPEFSKIKINKIEENTNKEVANSYDYYYVPCFWIEKNKIHEGPVSKKELIDIFLQALKD
ncbi:MAG: thioredoxin family protein [Bacilli bacterium]|nr:thioredoxin family protein [Bacilli bacterium]